CSRRATTGPGTRSSNPTKPWRSTKAAGARTSICGSNPRRGPCACASSESPQPPEIRVAIVVAQDRFPVLPGAGHAHRAVLAHPDPVPMASAVQDEPPEPIGGVDDEQRAAEVAERPADAELPVQVERGTRAVQAHVRRSPALAAREDFEASYGAERRRHVRTARDRGGVDRARPAIGLLRDIAGR